VTDRGRPTHVLMSIETYRELKGERDTIADLLAMREPVEADLDTARAEIAWVGGELD